MNPVDLDYLHARIDALIEHCALETSIAMIRDHGGELTTDHEGNLRGRTAEAVDMARQRFWVHDNRVADKHGRPRRSTFEDIY